MGAGLKGPCLRIFVQILQIQEDEQEPTLPATAFQQLRHGSQVGVAVRLGDDGLVALGQDDGPLDSHGPPLPVSVRVSRKIGENR